MVANGKYKVFGFYDNKELAILFAVSIFTLHF
jgi:hypothetical protein